LNEGKLTIRYSSGKELVYPVSERFVLNLTKFNEGDSIGYIHVLFSPTYRYDCVSSLLSAFGTTSRKANKNEIPSNVSYSPFEGVIKYEYLPNNRVKILIDDNIVGVYYLNLTTLVY
jgi:hypothetical protein